MKSVSLNMTSVEVKSEIRPLKVSWTREMASDLDVYHGLDIDDLENILRKELRRDLRKSKVRKLFK